MKNKNPEPGAEEAGDDFAHLFEEMVDLLKMAVDNSKNEAIPILPNDLEAKLERLEEDVEIFCRLNESIAKDKSNGEILENPLDVLSSREKLIYERSKKVVAEAEVERARIEAELKDAISKGLSLTPDPTTLEARKKHFKRYGTRSKWKRM